MTDSEARDEMYAVMNTAWNAGAITAIAAPASINIRFVGIPLEEPTGYWVRISSQIIEQLLASMADETTFGNNKRRYETSGIVFAQLFAPKSEKNAYDKGFRVAQILRNAFRSHGQSGNVTFTNARINPLSEDGSSYKWNVVADFSYDTVQ